MGLDPEREAGGNAPGAGSAASDDGTDAETSESATPKPKRRLSAYLWAMLVARVLGALPLLCVVERHICPENSLRQVTLS